jgi:type II secretory pathway component PulC
MRQPFWIVNSALLLLACITAGFLYFSRPEIPTRTNIEPTPYRMPAQTESSKVNINKIYEYDLFDTYQRELVPPEVPEQIGPIPEPPAPIEVRVPEEPKPQFIEPLPISLKGIIIVLTDDAKNRAIIMDNRTSKEGSFKVGDMIEDAQLIRIFSNKVILMRANGQQEVLYLREKDAKLDPTYAAIDGWEGVITQVQPYKYTINTAEFVNRIQSLGQFIDTLEVITAYRAGESVGCRVTNVGPGTLAQALGLTKDDLILKVNDTSVAETGNRLAIFKQISELKTNDVITVTLVRNGQEVTLNYELLDVRAARKQDIGQKKPSPETIVQEQRKSLEQKGTFAPTLKEIREREKANMFEKGKRPTQNVLSNLNG